MVWQSEDKNWVENCQGAWRLIIDDLGTFIGGGRGGCHPFPLEKVAGFVHLELSNEYRVLTCITAVCMVIGWSQTFHWIMKHATH